MFPACAQCRNPLGQEGKLTRNAQPVCPFHVPWWACPRASTSVFPLLSRLYRATLLFASFTPTGDNRRLILYLRLSTAFFLSPFSSLVSYLKSLTEGDKQWTTGRVKSLAHPCLCNNISMAHYWPFMDLVSHHPWGSGGNVTHPGYAAVGSPFLQDF